MRKLLVPLEYGCFEAEIRTALLYKVNVVLAVLLLAGNYPSLIASFLNQASSQILMVKAIACLVSSAYFLFALNFYLDRITIYQNGMVWQNLISQKSLSSQDIQGIHFPSAGEKYILVLMKEGKEIKLSVKKYDDLRPLAVFCKKYKLAL